MIAQPASAGVPKPEPFYRPQTAGSSQCTGTAGISVIYKICRRKAQV